MSIETFGLFRHLLTCNREQILARSLVNCHSRGVHSIMLLEAPGRSIRLFVTDRKHDLWNNSASGVSAKRQTVAFHAHHCELTLSPVKGEIYNWTVGARDVGDPDAFMSVGEFEYRSAITDGAIGFRRTGQRALRTISNAPIEGPVYMPAALMHTVYVPPREIAAWFVFEGRENPGHDGRCYSSADLERADFSDLYKPMTAEKLATLVQLIEQ